MKIMEDWKLSKDGAIFTTYLRKVVGYRPCVGTACRIPSGTVNHYTAILRGARAHVCTGVVLWLVSLQCGPGSEPSHLLSFIRFDWN